MEYTFGRFVLGWIVFQLVIIGIAGGATYAQFKNGKLPCADYQIAHNATTTASGEEVEYTNGIGEVIMGAAIPLIFFTPDVRCNP